MRPRTTLALAAAALACTAPSASAAAPVEGYRSPDNRVGCVLYQGYDAAGNAVECGRRGSDKGLLLTSTGAARRRSWRWPARRLGSLFFRATYGQTLYLYGGTAKLQGDETVLRCVFRRSKGVRCTNREGFAIVVTRRGNRRYSPWERPITSSMISSVPAPMRFRRRSRQVRSIPYSFM